MEANATPRINGPLLGKYVGKNVTIWGKVTQLRGEEATVDANGSVRAKLNRVRRVKLTYMAFASAPTLATLTQAQESHLVPGNGVQIIGKVQPDLSVKVLNSIDLGTGVGKRPLPTASPAD